MSSPEVTSLISALGTLIGYLGSEASSDDLFERILWPQRFFNPQWSWHLIPAALFMPMGGPMHRGALQALDKLRDLGLFKGRNKGNMLGTVFFRDLGHTYISLDDSANDAGTKSARNAIWARLSKALSYPSAAHPLSRSLNTTTGKDHTSYVTLAVNTIKLTLEPSEGVPRRLLVREDQHMLGLTVLVVIWTELTALAMAGVVFGVWRSMYGFLWIAPVLLKIIACLLHVSRQPLVVPGQEASDEYAHFRIETQGQDLLVVEGNKHLLLQFFRHYGHPVRDRIREIILMAVIVLFGFNFFVGLTLSVVSMPFYLQYTWLAYQLYATFALFVYRYASGERWLTTESHMAAKLARNAHRGQSVVYLGDKRGSAIKIELTRAEVNRVAEGEEYIRQYQAAFSKV